MLKLAFTKVSGKLQLSYNVKAFESNAEKDYDSCSFFGSGTGPTNAKFDHLCLQNPAVNLLPIKASGSQHRECDLVTLYPDYPFLSSNLSPLCTALLCMPVLFVIYMYA